MQAVSWYADQQLAQALRHGTIVPQQAAAHWEKSASDLLDDRALLLKIERAHLRAKDGKSVSSIRILHDHDGLGPADLNAPEASPFGRGEPPPAAVIAGALALAVAAPMAPLFAYSAYAGSGSAMQGQSAPPPLRREQELPPDGRPELVQKPVGRRGKDDGEKGRAR
ncbi:MAG: hypothetical protein SFW63_03065 [Alphaproteobacteria bacterium]|nr:hypothetical protein [Alphaproteobacteria bacterium]